jgi:hypothetical protein
MADEENATVLRPAVAEEYMSSMEQVLLWIGFGIQAKTEAVLAQLGDELSEITFCLMRKQSDF